MFISNPFDNYYYPYINNYMYRSDSPSNQLSIRSKDIKSSNENIKEDLRIPVIQGAIAPNILQFINSNINNDIMEFKRQMEEAAEENAERAEKNNQPINPYRISNIYVVTYNKNNILSLSLIYEQIINGRTYYTRTTYNYDIQSGRSLSVLDLFKPGINAKSLINTEIMKELGNPQKYFLEPSTA